MSTRGVDNTLIRVFGGVDLLVDGEVHGVGGPRQRRLLALLAVRARQVVDVDWLAEYLWDDDDRPEATAGALRTYVSRLRNSLPPEAREWVVTEPGGYRLDASPSAIESELFVSLRQEARFARESGDPERARRLLDEALDLWRGAPFRELEDLDWVRSEVERLEIDRLEVLEERWETALDLGRHTQITGELAAFTAQHGHRERAARQYALALHRSGRTQEALRVIDRHRRLLSDSGLEPSSEMLEFEDAILSGDASLDYEGDATPLRGYRLIERVGAGAFAVVWKAVQPSVDRLVAIKQIREELATQPDFIRRFELEAQIVARIEHPHIVPLIDFWRDPDAAYLVMRWLAGGTLERRLDGGPLTVSETLRIADQVGAALAAAHAQAIVHRDVKSANVMFDDAGNAFLTDFGIALAEAESSGPAAALSIGSPAYAAPEQLRREPLGPASDVYSLAVVIYECLTGVTPFADSADSAELLDRQLTAQPPLDDVARIAGPQLASALRQALAKSPEDRFSSVEAFLDAMRATGAPTDPKPKRVRVGPNPYVGLRAFDVGDVDRYFGRERLVTELVERLRAGDMASRALVVVGPSGSGKSSVVRAGLLPRLHRGDVEDSDTWFTTTMIPGNDPFEALEAALLRVAVNPPNSLLDQLEDGPRGILRGVRRCLPSDRDVLLLTIDQFEELFLGRAASLADDFLDALSVAVADPTSPLRLVATLRADYYHRPLQHPAFAPILKAGAVEVTPLAPDELEEAIVGPARESGAEFEPGLVARIAAETIGQASPLPLLQHVLAALFEQREGTTLTIDAYERLGGVAGALAARAESIYVQSTDPERAAMRRVFGAMSDPVEDRPDLRRRIVVVDLGRDPATRSVLDRFGEARLITFDRDPVTREPTVEVAHEALLREWPRLGQWLDEDKELLRSIERLATAADVWEEGGLQDSDLLRGGRLAQALDLPTGAITRALDLEFLEASRVQAERDREAERRRVVRLRRLNAVVSVALVAALIAGGVALAQRNQAQEASDAAEASAQSAQQATEVAQASEQRAEALQAEAELAALLSRSESLIGEQPEAAILVAVEAYRRDPDRASAAAVLGALSAAPGRFSTVDLPLNVGPPCPAFDFPLVVSADASTGFTTDGDRLLTVDLDTGAVEDRGSAPASCVQWFGDEGSDVRWVMQYNPTTDTGLNDGRGTAFWSGSWDGPLEPATIDGAESLIFGALGADRLLAGGAHDSVLIVDATSQEIVGRVDASLGLTALGPVRAAEGDPIAMDVVGGTVAVMQVSQDPGLVRSIGIVDLESGLQLHSIEIDEEPSAIGVGGGRVFVGGVFGGVYSIDVTTGETDRLTSTSATSPIFAIGPRPDGLVVVVSGDRIELVDPDLGLLGDPFFIDVGWADVRPDGAVTVLDDAVTAATRVDMRPVPIADASVDIPDDAVVALDAGHAALLGDRGGVELIELESGERWAAILDEDLGTFEPMVAFPAADGADVVVLGEDGRVGRWQNGELVASIQIEADPQHPSTFAHLGYVTSNASGFDYWRIVLDPAFVPSHARSGAILLHNQFLFGIEARLIDWDAGLGTRLVSDSNIDLVSAVPSTRGGVHTINEDGLVRTYDAEGTWTGEFRIGLEEALIAVSGPADVFAAGGTTGAVVADAESGTATAIPGAAGVVGLEFVDSGRLLVVVEVDGDVKLWDVEDASLLGHLMVGTGTTRSVMPWYDEETRTVWVSSSGRLYGFGVDPSRWVERACAFVDRELTPEEWSQFVPGESPQEPGCP